MANRYIKTGEFRKCQTCSCDIYLMPYEVASGRKKFCSKKCLYESDIHTNLFQCGHKDLVPNSSRGHSGKTKEKISQSLKGRFNGSKSWNWKDGISAIDKRVRRMKEYLDWRGSIFKRDDFTCVYCGYNGYVTAHHIKSFANILRENRIADVDKARLCTELWDINNGITLCEDCHSQTDNYKGRGRNRE